MKKLIALLALSGCATVTPPRCIGPVVMKDAAGYEWCQTHEPIALVEDKVIETREEFVRRCGGYACALRLYEANPPRCFVLSLYAPLPQGSYIRWHEEEMHCRKGMGHAQ
jgi:hypothetical protein